MNINDSELLIAVRKSIANSKDLISDADLLRENKRFPRAYTLYQLAMEEVGKAMDIYGSMILGTLNDKKGRSEPDLGLINQLLIEIRKRIYGS